MKSVIILCGGFGRRMGQDKGLMLYPEKPLIVQVIENISQSLENSENCEYEVVLVLRNSKQQKKYEKVLDEYGIQEIKICRDDMEDQGPLMGIYAGLKCIRADEALIVPCDSPDISKEFIDNIYGYYNPLYDAAVPEWPDGKLEPLHAIYHKRITENIAEDLKNGVRDVKSLLLSLDVRYIPFYSLDKSEKSFFNLNYPDDVPSLD